MRTPALLLFLFLSFTCFAQPKPKAAKKPTAGLNAWDKASSGTSLGIRSISDSTLPAEIDYRGWIVEALQWDDSSGANILLLTHTGPYFLSDDVPQKAEICAYLFCKSDTAKTYTRKWKVYDFSECFGLDFYAEFYTHSLTITDLDNDGFAEITMLYVLVCRGGMDPATKKLILYENTSKYAIRGETMICPGNGAENNYGGAYTADEALKNNPLFQEFALLRWNIFRCDEMWQY